ncbi:MAG: cytochrome c [Ferruginibacter sp.]
MYYQRTGNLDFMHPIKNSLKAVTIRVSLLVMLSTISSCNQQKENSTQIKNNLYPDTALGGSEVYIDLKKLLIEDDNRVATDVMVNYDPFFKTSKKYRGYYINSTIDSVIKSAHFDTAGAIIIFECIDGYKPVMDLSKLYQHAKGYFAFKDLEKSVERNWPDSINKKFAPFYLVWDDVKKDDNSFVWPYGLIAMKLVPGKVKYKSIYPYQDTTLVKGFNLFKENCLKCHSINKIGGTMGPEFNIPKNITEYWREEDIISFAKNPSAYRYNSSMPPVTNLSDAELKEIVKYIQSMTNQ